MKAVILMGGTGSRLEPLNRVINKHLINVGGKPMSQWLIEQLRDKGFGDILIVTGKEHMGSIIAYYGDGSDFGCNFTYKVQNGVGGIAEAVKLVNGFVHEDEFFVVALGDNIFEKIDILDHVTNRTELMLAYKRVEDPSRFGVIDLRKNVIIEKPKNPTTELAVVGLYGYKYNDKFKKMLDGLVPSERDELEITDLNNLLLYNTPMENRIVGDINGYWTDAGTHESLKLANKLKYGDE